ncbi:MAG: hypothetical protein QME66_05565 [Candidatus Eisenbacteria bacterium]|nr:hypothetical protein [Candidatus Eisenbacteria bacterium]
MGIFSEIKKAVSKRKVGTYRSMSGNGFVQVIDEGSITFQDGTVIGRTQKVDTRESKKPIEVWELLKDQTEPIVDTSNLVQKIKTIKKRIKILEDHVSIFDLNAEYTVLGFLEARKKYDTYKHLFSYPTTHEQAIRNLCATYRLKIVPVTQYSGTMPEEAIDELLTFKHSCLKIRKDKPVVRLIVQDFDPKTELKKRDPILLVSSPFGNWDYVLGAWDKEVLIVDELIYMGK